MGNNILKVLENGVMRVATPFTSEELQKAYHKMSSIGLRRQALHVHSHGGRTWYRVLSPGHKQQERKSIEQKDMRPAKCTHEICAPADIDGRCPYREHQASSQLLGKDP